MREEAFYYDFVTITYSNKIKQEAKLTALQSVSMLNILLTWLLSFPPNTQFCFVFCRLFVLLY